ncbi:MAG TPA: L,D-transpeptidase [Verrucomicrobiae bacterium]
MSFKVSMPRRDRLPAAFVRATLKHGVPPSRFVLVVTVADQTMSLFERSKASPSTAGFPPYTCLKRYRISTSRFGVGQVENSNQTPLGLHRIAQKIGGGWPIGTVFKSRQVVGLTWQGLPDATIAHRLFWLDGLEPGFNRGGQVDSHRRFIYIHGFGDESTLGRPQSHGCIHVAAADLLPLFDRLPTGTLVWIAER